VVNANGMTTTSASLPTACVVPVLILQGSMLMDRSVMAMESVSLVTVREIFLQVVLVNAKERETKAKAAMHSPAMTLRALMNVNVGPAQILQGSMVIEGSVITMENVRLVTVRDLVLGSVVLVPVQERKGKAKDAVEGLAMTRSAYINAHAGPAQIREGSFLMEKNVIGRANVDLILVESGGKVLVVMQGVDDDLRISRLLLAVGYSDVHVYYWN